MTNAIIISVLAVFSLMVYAQQGDHQHTMSHTTHGDHHNHHSAATSSATDVIATPTEPGQAAFAAIAEVVDLLEKDPNTDWSKVDINALREHLVDMHNLTLYAEVSQQRSANTIAFSVTGTGDALRAIKNMVPIHAMMVADARQWDIATRSFADGIELTIHTDNQSLQEKLAAIGFFGFMSLENHHQTHHLQMVQGNGHFH